MSVTRAATSPMSSATGVFQSRGNILNRRLRDARLRLCSSAFASSVVTAITTIPSRTSTEIWTVFVDSVWTSGPEADGLPGLALADRRFVVFELLSIFVAGFLGVAM